VGQKYLAQDVTSTLELQLKAGFFMFRDTARPEQPVAALWFPDEDKESGAAVINALNRLVREYKDRDGVAPGAFAPGDVAGTT
jgi:hypothetical protein